MGEYLFHCFESHGAILHWLAKNPHVKLISVCDSLNAAYPLCAWYYVEPK